MPATLPTTLTVEDIAQTAQALNSGTLKTQNVSVPPTSLTTSRMKTPATAAPYKKETGTIVPAINVLNKSLISITASAINAPKMLPISGILMDIATNAPIQILMRS